MIRSEILKTDSGPEKTEESVVPAVIIERAHSSATHQLELLYIYTLYYWRLNVRGYDTESQLNLEG